MLALPAGPAVLCAVPVATDGGCGDECAAGAAGSESGAAGAGSVQQALIELRKRGFNRIYQDGRVFEFSSPEDLLDVDFAKPVYVLVDRLALSPECVRG